MVQLPEILVYVKSEFLGFKSKNPFKKAYLLAVDTRTSMALKFTVYLDSGAVWSGLPIEALYCDKFGSINTKIHYENQILQPFSCLSNESKVIEYGLIKNAEIKSRTLGKGHYMFTINYIGLGLSEDPEQYKTHNIVCLENGQLAALPNNDFTVVDNWFVDDNAKEELKFYRRNKKHYFPGG